MLDSAGSLAPAFGMIGTLIGLIQMLQNLKDPDAIGPGMAVALDHNLLRFNAGKFDFYPDGWEAGH